MSTVHRMVNILKLLEIFTISKLFDVSLMRLCNFFTGSRPPSRQMFSAFAMRTRTCLRKRKPVRARSYGYAFGHEPS